VGTWAQNVYAKFTSPAELMFWLWLAIALVVSDLLYRFGQRQISEAVGAARTPRPSYTHASSLLDYKLLLTDRLITASILAPMLVSAVAVGRWGATMLTSRLGPGPAWQTTVLVLVAFAGVRLLLFDIGHYISHRIQHTVPFFWEFHKVHHAAEVLTPVTAYRVHPLEPLLDSAFQGPLQALGFAVFYYLYGTEQSLMTFIGMNAVIFPYFFIDSLRHSHVWFSFGPTLEHIFSSPAQHQIHHSRAPQHLNKNLSQYFSFIDWIGGTLYVTDRIETLQFGLSHGRDEALKNVRSAYWVPVDRAIRGLFRAKSNDAELDGRSQASNTPTP
jgi:sterol desaturase/sphingolipid hydroxylase (fatty acid hydroxylase superfamily)